MVTDVVEVYEEARRRDKNWHVDFYEASFQTELCGTLTVAMTKKPSKSKVFANVGSRIYFRGVSRVQGDLNQVKKNRSNLDVKHDSLDAGLI